MGVGRGRRGGETRWGVGESCDDRGGDSIWDGRRPDFLRGFQLCELEFCGRESSSRLLLLLDELFALEVEPLEVLLSLYEPVVGAEKRLG